MSDQKGPITPRVIVQLLFFVVLIPFLPLLISRHWDWWQAWIYALSSILNFAISRILAAQRNTDLIAERSRTMQHQDAKAWDKQLAPFLGLGGISIMVVAGLDRMSGWSPMVSLPLTIGSLVMILAGYILTSYALIENRFFSGMVRLQTDRGHQVVSSGPYGWIRHPGYAGALLAYLATPIFLDSRWAFVPTLFTIILFVIRTALEDRFLQDELEGYQEYAERVHYRLLPGIW